MANRHKSKKASGGVALPNTGPSEVYAGGGSNVVKEARERKHGGKAMGHADGAKAKMRMDRRPGRKRGGGVGSNMKPLSTAATVSKQNAVTNQDSEAG